MHTENLSVKEKDNLFFFIDNVDVISIYIVINVFIRYTIYLFMSLALLLRKVCRLEVMAV